MTLIEFTKKYVSFVFGDSREHTINGLYDFEYEILNGLMSDKNTLFIKSRQMYLTTMYTAYILWFLLYDNSYDKEIYYISRDCGHIYRNIDIYLTKYLHSLNSDSYISKSKTAITLGDKSINFKNALNESVSLLPHRDICKIVILDEYPEDAEFINLLNTFRMLGVRVSIGKSLTFNEVALEGVYYTATDFITHKFPYYLNPNWETEKVKFLTDNKVLFFTSMDCEFINHKNEYMFTNKTPIVLGYADRKIFKKAKKELIKILGHENIHPDEL